MIIRQVRYLIALAKTQHFGRAAELCNVTQPTLSTAVHNLEEELGVVIVRRGHRFQGFTPEGERLLEWARKLEYDWMALRQEASTCTERLAGTLRFGAIPTSLPVVPLFTQHCLTGHPGVSVQLKSLCSDGLIRQLDDYEIDLGISYLDDPRIKGFRCLPLYREHHVLLSRDELPFEHTGSISWREAAELPLCLLSQDMQNRKLIDAAFREAGVVPRVAIETDSVMALYSHVRCSQMCSIVPHSLLFLFELRQEVNAVPLVPDLTSEIGLIARKEDPSPPLIKLAFQVANDLNLQVRLNALIDVIN